MRLDTVLSLLKLGRFRFIPPGFLLYCLGTLWAVFPGPVTDPARLLAGYLVLFPAHLSVSYSNEYFDRHSDAGGQPGPVSGGTGVLREHPELAGTALGIAVALIGISLALGMAFIEYYGIDPRFFLFILAGNLVGWFYSAPPLRFSGTRLGELSTAVAMGILLPGMGYYVAGGAFDPGFVTLALPFLLFGYYFIISVEMPDGGADRESGKNTLVARRGTAFGRRAAVLAALLGSLSLVIPPLLGVSPPGFPLPGAFSLLPLLSAYLGLRSPCTTPACITGLSARNVGSLVAFILFADLSLLGLMAAA